MRLIYLKSSRGLGPKQTLRNLLDESHRRRYRILLDLVPNHVSNLHPTFQSAISDPESPYKKWYTFTNWPDKYLSFFDVPNYLNSTCAIHLRGSICSMQLLIGWILELDGYRVDYAIGPAPDFWADFRRVTRQSRPDCWTFGEVVEPPDSQLNFCWWSGWLP